MILTLFFFLEKQYHSTSLFSCHRGCLSLAFFLLDSFFVEHENKNNLQTNICFSKSIRDRSIYCQDILYNIYEETTNLYLCLSRKLTSVNHKSINYFSSLWRKLILRKFFLRIISTYLHTLLFNDSRRLHKTRCTLPKDLISPVFHALHLFFILSVASVFSSVRDVGECRCRSFVKRIVPLKINQDKKQ